MTQRRVPLLFFVGLLASPTIAWAASPADVAGTVVWGDFNGDHVRERAVSSPEDNCNKGAVYVVGATGSPVKWTRDTTGVLGTATCDDYFGAALAAGDFNKDGRDDLAIGAPGADDAGVSAAGAVHVLYGSSTGLTEAGDQLWQQNSTGIDDTAEVDDFFGEVLGAGDFNCDTADELVVGVPSENIGSATSDAGAVQVLYGSAGGVTSTDSLFYQGNAGVDGTAESTDRFGAALAIGNFNNDLVSGHRCEDLAVGSPTEDTGTITDAGWVYTMKGGSSGLSTTSDLAFDQNTTGVVDSCEGGDRFGARLLVRNENGDAYDDLAVAVPGDSCLSPHGSGRHMFRGSSTGITLTGNYLECDLFRCEIQATSSEYRCPSFAAPVRASTGVDTLRMFASADIVFADAGNDAIYADDGDDTIVGGAGNDTIDVGAGRDVAIAGAGNDYFVLDRGCEAVAGKVLDGGPGTDTVRSHMSSSALAAAGVTLVSIESFSTISAGVGNCDPMAYEEGPFRQPPLVLAWDDLPDPDSVFSTTSGILELDVTNTSNASVVTKLNFRLLMRGNLLEDETSTLTVPANGAITHNLDLNDFIPIGVDPGTLDPALLDLAASAILTAHASILRSGVPFENAFAPKLYGHLQDGDTAVVYREDAYHAVYHSGDLVGWRNGDPAYSGTAVLMGVLEAKPTPAP